MFLKTSLQALVCILAANASGCCIFCPEHSWFWHGCGANHCGPAACGPMDYGPGYYETPSYGQCVVPPGCPECGTGMYGASCDPVQRARAQRLGRMRHRDYACSPRCRTPRMPHDRMPRHPRCRGDYGMDCYGYDGYGFDGYDQYGYDPYGYDLMGYEDGYGQDEFALMSHSGWMPTSGGCQTCGDFGGGMVMSADSGWTVTSSDCPTCGPSTTTQPTPAGTALQPVPQQGIDVKSSAVTPMSAQEYYVPRPMPAPSGPGTSIESTSAGTPVQPVLWVPQGL
jgi:hypothetical protein